MAEISLSTEHGRLNVHGWRKGTMAAAAELGRTLFAGCQRPGDFVELDGWRAYLKGGPLRGASAWRHGARRRLLGRHVPRIREYENLSWLIERHFQAALPLAAGVFWRAGLPRYQFLLTARVDDAPSLDLWWPSAAAADREEVLGELARELARMHALGFLHHDLYPRNLLVREAGSARRVVFLDAWAGGPPPQCRGPAYDLGALFLTGAELFDEREQTSFLARYLDEREGQGRPAARDALLRAAVRERARLRAQLIARPHRSRGAALPREEWSPGALLARRGASERGA